MTHPNPEILLQQLLFLHQQQPASSEIIYALAMLYQNLQQLEQARYYYLQGLELAPQSWEAHFHLAGIYSLEQSFEQASSHYQQALQLDPLRQPAWFGLANLYTRKQDWTRLEQLYAELLRQFPELQQSPAIFLNTLPRSASIYLTTALRLMLGREFLMVAEIDSIDDPLYEISARLLASGGVVSQAHLPASPHNLELLNRWFKQLVIHIRDPRQASLSLVYLFNQRLQGQRVKFNPAPPVDYPGWQLSEQIDWNLEYAYPRLLEWIMGWLRVIDEHSFQGRIYLSRYEDFVAEPERFYQQLLGFYGLCSEMTQLDYKPAVGYLNFRKGQPQEWRSIMSPAQQALANRLLPQALKKIFD